MLSAFCLASYPYSHFNAILKNLSANLYVLFEIFSSQNLTKFSEKSSDHLAKNVEGYFF